MRLATAKQRNADIWVRHYSTVTETLSSFLSPWLGSSNAENKFKITAVACFQHTDERKETVDVLFHGNFFVFFSVSVLNFPIDLELRTSLLVVSIRRIIPNLSYILIAFTLIWYLILVPRIRMLKLFPFRPRTSNEDFGQRRWRYSLV